MHLRELPPPEGGTPTFPPSRATGVTTVAIVAITQF
jgi:hypothetical protein